MMSQCVVYRQLDNTLKLSLTDTIQVVSRLFLNKYQMKLIQKRFYSSRTLQCSLTMRGDHSGRRKEFKKKNRKVHNGLYNSFGFDFHRHTPRVGSAQRTVGKQAGLREEEEAQGGNGSDAERDCLEHLEAEHKRQGKHTHRQHHAMRHDARCRWRRHCEQSAEGERGGEGRGKKC